MNIHWLCTELQVLRKEAPLKKVKPTSNKSSKLTLESWEDASSVDELKSLKMTELKQHSKYNTICMT